MSSKQRRKEIKKGAATQPEKYYVYRDASFKPCISEPSCRVHKHRPRPPPCPQPDECYRACIRRKEKCPSALATVRREGAPCDCARLQSESSRLNHDVHYRSHRARIQKAYATRSSISRIDTEVEDEAQTLDSTNSRTFSARSCGADGQRRSLRRNPSCVFQMGARALRAGGAAAASGDERCATGAANQLTFVRYVCHLF
ncbi:uncharacterized protein LOC126372691 [Pectinophora gossypiella]|uniref:uncharacterized protein LOC126372691 n=1 Tax=Pectinophora gossypiella TaxID=13191 RepID=UPI00214F0E3D|nr:uncharacterized protein LOC126372691 [Pectinophora gossypiella]